MWIDTLPPEAAELDDRGKVVARARGGVMMMVIPLARWTTASGIGKAHRYDQPHWVSILWLPEAVGRTTAARRGSADQRPAQARRRDRDDHHAATASIERQNGFSMNSCASRATSAFGHVHVRRSADHLLALAPDRDSGHHPC
jgi:hypothetical protein